MRPEGEHETGADSRTRSVARQGGARETCIGEEAKYSIVRETWVRRFRILAPSPDPNRYRVPRHFRQIRKRCRFRSSIFRRRSRRRAFRTRNRCQAERTSALRGRICRRVALLGLGTRPAVHHAVAQNPDVGVFVARDRRTAAHAARKQRVDRSRHLFHSRIVTTSGDVHGGYVAFICPVAPAAPSTRRG
jgi:hypothetical protein